MNEILQGDNLKIMKNIPTATIDLIYADPPFFSQRDYGEFKDTWETFEYYLDYMTVRLQEMYTVLKPTGSLYLHCDPTASHYLKIVLDAIFGNKNFRNEIVWSYRTGGSSKTNWSKKHDTLLFYSKTDAYIFNTQKEKSYTKSESRKPGVINYGAGTAEFFEDEQGVYNLVNARDVWDISYINSQSKERMGYPTQKPETLLEKIINASSNEGDVILDPFCGCGTTLAVAQKLKRKWIGIDISSSAITLAKLRLNSHVE